MAFNNLESGQTYKMWVPAEREAGKGEHVHASITLPQAEPRRRRAWETGNSRTTARRGNSSGWVEYSGKKRASG